VRLGHLVINSPLFDSRTLQGQATVHKQVGSNLGRLAGTYTVIDITSIDKEKKKILTLVDSHKPSKLPLKFSTTFSQVLQCIPPTFRVIIPIQIRITHNKQMASWVPVGHACNPSNLRSRDE
jgi:hypothetical protein